MTTIEAKTLEATIDIAADPERVWPLVADLPGMAQRSPQVVRSFQTGDGTVGTTTVNINRSGWKVWPTRAKVIRHEAPREFAFRVKDNKTIWSYTLEPLADGGTRVVQRREAPDGLAPASAKLQGLMMGGLAKFDEELLAGMRTTLERIKVEAER
ncbi:SRPBCC family protein [Nocardioides humilatus]|uniref:SRPBCC family protein n=1 Tax=Nocardioides humilatus TaxID=2607660 RepID=A0A5B1L3Z9_9ACTN|nr:SRPBCC family protein [Nocardioides humilatus]KAA1415411.1 SRPBCC family protein [Nocardioides humilatus]